MAWWTIIPAVISAVQSMGQQASANAGVDANNTVNTANTAAANLVRSANNTLRAARGSLSRYNQSVNNQRTLENAGREAEAAAVNYRRARDSAINDSLENQIAFAEQAGAQRAASSLSNLTGGVADIVSGTTALRKARIQQRMDEATKQGDHDASLLQSRILQAGWDSLDHSEITDDLDYGVDMPVIKPVTASTLGAGIQGFVSGGGTSAMQSFFTTPGYDAFSDRAGVFGSGSDGRQRTITGGR